MTEATTRPRVGVACLVTRGGQILLLRRQRSHGAGSWSPPGGHLDFGESIEACAMRETHEETGLRIANPEFFGITNDIFEPDGKHYVTVWMHAEADGGEPAVQDQAEVAAVGWFEPDRLPTPLFLSLANLIAGRVLMPVAGDVPWPAHRSPHPHIPDSESPP